MQSLWRLIHGGNQHFGKICLAAAASATSVSVVGLRKRQQEECYRDGETQDTVSCLKKLLSLSPPSQMVKCDAALLSSVPRLRRLPTIEKLQKTAVPDTLESKYQVQWKKPIGEGAFSTVFPAVHRITGEKVAVKQIKKKFANNLSFEREMDALLLLRESGGHPNICSLRENFDQGDYFYIILDMVTGREMFDQLCFAGPYSEADAARHIQEVTSALAFCHGLGLVHADLKPENIMLSSKDDADAVVKLVDLGCAHLLANAPFLDHQQKATGNTPAYCPPEVLLEGRRNKYSHATIAPSFDMWSLGVVIYIMLIGAHPFDLDASATNEEIEQRIISGKKPPLGGSRFADHLSEDAIALIEGLMDWDPRKRMTAEQVLENRWVRGETASSKKIADSDHRLAALRKYKTRIGSAFFKTLLSQTDAIHRTKTNEQVSVLESAFRQLDSGHDGFLSIRGDILESEDEDTKLSLSDVLFLLAENMKNRYFQRDQVVYNEGDSGDMMYLINSGTVEVTTKDGFKKLRKPGELFGDEVMHSPETSYTNTVRCLTPVHVHEISRELFEKYVSSDEDTFLRMAETNRHRRRERANTILRLNKEC